MMVMCSSPGCPNVVPSTLDRPRGKTATVLCAFHAAEIRPAEPKPTITAQPNPWQDDPLGALRDAIPALEAVHAWNQQVSEVANLLANPDRVHGVVVEVSRDRNLVEAHESAALTRDQAYVVDLDRLSIAPAVPKLVDIPFTTTERTDP